MKHLTRFWMACLAALAIAGVAQGAVLVSYDADSQAVAPAPTSVDGGLWTVGGLNNANVTPTAGSDGDGNYWALVDNNAGGTANSAKNYSLDSGASINDPTGWTATAVLKVNSASGTASGLTLEVRGGGNLFNLSFVNDGANEYIAQSVQGNTAPVLIANVDLDAKFNTVQMYYDPGAGTANVYVDGGLIGTISPGSSSLQRVLWGSNTSSATSDSQWREVRLETGNHVVPEPGSMALLSVGTVMLLRRRKERN